MAKQWAHLKKISVPSINLPVSTSDKTIAPQVQKGNDARAERRLRRSMVKKSAETPKEVQNVHEKQEDENQEILKGKWSNWTRRMR